MTGNASVILDQHVGSRHPGPWARPPSVRPARLDPGRPRAIAPPREEAVVLLLTEGEQRIEGRSSRRRPRSLALGRPRLDEVALRRTLVDLRCGSAVRRIG